MHVHQAHLLALGQQVVHGLLGGLRGGAHEYDHALCVGSSVVVEQMIVSACDLIDFFHIMLDSRRDLRHGLVAGLAALEEDVRVYGGSAGGRVLRI